MCSSHRAIIIISTLISIMAEFWNNFLVLFLLPWTVCFGDIEYHGNNLRKRAYRGSASSGTRLYVEIMVVHFIMKLSEDT